MNYDQEINKWIEKEAEETRAGLAAYRRKGYRMMPLFCLLTVAGFIALGFLVGGTVDSVMRVHVPVGIGAAAFVALCFLVSYGRYSVKKVKKLYEKAVEKRLLDPQDQKLFLDQIQSGEYDTAQYVEKDGGGITTKVLIGKDYWVYRNYLNCIFVKVSAVDKITDVQSSARVKVGNTWTTVSTGTNLQIYFKKEAGKKKDRPDVFFNLPNDEAAKGVYRLIDRYCHDLLVKK